MADQPGCGRPSCHVLATMPNALTIGDLRRIPSVPCSSSGGRSPEANRPFGSSRAFQASITERALRATCHRGKRYHLHA